MTDIETLGKIFFQQAQINIKTSENPVPNPRVVENTHTLQPPNLVQRPDINPISQYIENGTPTLRVPVAPTIASNIQPTHIIQTHEFNKSQKPNKYN